MKTRFSGPEGRRLLVDVLRTQHLVEHDTTLANRLAEAGEVVTFNTGDPVIQQDSEDNDIYFIVDGEVGVFVNKRSVATRGPRDSVGEMALVDGSSRRSASVLALKPVCALRLTEACFQQIAIEHPRIWRSLAIVVADRLRQRMQFHHPPNDKPVVFIGSSTEALPVAKQIQIGLKFAPVVARLWTNGVFGPGAIAIDSLLQQVERSDFAVFVFAPDDTVTSRGVEYFTPRDNVVFELGLFLGRLDRDRCYLVTERSSNIKIPSDLLGINSVTYLQAPGIDLTTAVSTVCTEIETAVGKLGVK